MIFRRGRRRREKELEPTDEREGALGAEPAEGVEPTEPGEGIEGAGPAEGARPVEGAGSVEGEGEGDEEPRIGVRESLRQVRQALAPLGMRRVVVAGLGISGLLVAGLLVFTGFSFWWTSQPSFCNRCHVMKPYVAAWKESPHKDVTCESCHLSPGVFGFVGGKIAGLQVVMNYIRGEYEDYSFNAAVSNASCLQCHETILDGNVHAGGIRVSHRNIIEMGGRCLSCHSTVAHDGAIKIGSETHPSMTTCLKCHNDQIAPLECSLCHTGRPRPSPTEETQPTSSPTAG